MNQYYDRAIADRDRPYSSHPTVCTFETSESPTEERVVPQMSRSDRMQDYPFQGANGKLTSAQMGRDITELKQQRLWKNLDASFNEIYIFDAETLYFEYINERARRNLGYSLAEIYQLTPLDIKPHFEEASFRTLMAPLLNGETETSIFQTVHRRKNGSEYPVEAYLKLVEENGDRVFLAVILDLTQRQQIEAEFRQKEAELKQQASQLEQSLSELQGDRVERREKMSALGQLMAGIAHEIHNPVNFFYANLSYISQSARELVQLVQLYREHYPLPAEALQTDIAAIDLDFLMDDLPKVLDSMKVGTQRIREMIVSLQHFSGLDDTQIEKVDVHEIIESALRMLDSRLKQCGSCPSIEAVKQYGELPLVECYPNLLARVFMELIVNAIEALETQKIPGQIAISTSVVKRVNSSDRPSIAIAISDNGPGMTPDVRRRAFEPFFTTKPIGQGTGLGLAISYSIVVEKHGGQLHCISSPDRGTKFILELPVD